MSIKAHQELSFDEAEILRISGNDTLYNLDTDETLSLIRILSENPDWLGMYFSNFPSMFELVRDLFARSMSPDTVKVLAIRAIELEHDLALSTFEDLLKFLGTEANASSAYKESRVVAIFGAVSSEERSNLKRAFPWAATIYDRQLHQTQTQSIPVLFGEIATIDTTEGLVNHLSERYASLENLPLLRAQLVADIGRCFAMFADSNQHLAKACAQIIILHWDTHPRDTALQAVFRIVGEEIYNKRVYLKYLQYTIPNILLVDFLTLFSNLDPVPIQEIRRKIVNIQEG